MLRLRVKAPAGAATLLRLTTYPLALSPIPLLVLASFEDRFPFPRSVWAALLVLNVGCVVFGVEFVARHAASDVVYELDETGVRVAQGSYKLRTMEWRRVRSVRLRNTSGNPAKAGFLLYGRGRILVWPVDEAQAPGLREKVAAAVARFAPSARHTGDAARVPWNPAAAWEGDFSFRDFGLSFVFASIAGMFIPALCLQYSLVAILSGFIETPWTRSVIGLAYAAYAFLALAIFNRIVRKAPAIGGSERERRVRIARWVGASFTAAVALVAVLAIGRI